MHQPRTKSRVVSVMVILFTGIAGGVALSSCAEATPEDLSSEPNPNMSGSPDGDGDDGNASDDPQTLADDAVAEIEQKAASASSSVKTCAKKCVKSFQTSMGGVSDTEETLELIDTLYSCSDKCFDAAGGASGSADGPKCFQTTTLGNIKYEIECADGQCACRKNGVEEMTCETAAPICKASSTASGVKAGCCKFQGTSETPNDPPEDTPADPPAQVPDDPPEDTPAPTTPAPTTPAPTMSPCNGWGWTSDGIVSVSCVNGKCSCKKSGTEVSTCTMRSTMECVATPVSTGVDIACCKFR